MKLEDIFQKRKEKKRKEKKKKIEINESNHSRK